MGSLLTRELCCHIFCPTKNPVVGGSSCLSHFVPRETQLSMLSHICHSLSHEKQLSELAVLTFVVEFCPTRNTVVCAYICCHILPHEKPLSALYHIGYRYSLFSFGRLVQPCPVPSYLIAARLIQSHLILIIKKSKNKTTYLV